VTSSTSTKRIIQSQNFNQQLQIKCKENRPRLCKKSVKKINKNTTKTFQCTYLARLKEKSNFLSWPFEDELLDFDGACFGGASFAGSLGCELDAPAIQPHSNIMAII